MKKVDKKLVHQDIKTFIANNDPREKFVVIALMTVGAVVSVLVIFAIISWVFGIVGTLLSWVFICACIYFLIKGAGRLMRGENK